MPINDFIADVIQEELALGGDAKSCAHAVLNALAEDFGLREEYAIVGHRNGDVAEGCEDADEAIESMELYAMGAWMAGRRWVSDWQNIEAPQLS
jgi:hypothetical protein